MQKIKLLVFQFCINYLKPNSSLQKINRLLKQYQYLRADLAIFPEYALTGPLYGHTDLSFSYDNPVFSVLKNIALKNRINIIPGSFVLIENDKRYNSSCFITNKGDIMEFYKKRKLWSSEKKYLSSGNDGKVFITPMGRIAIQICADLNDPAISAEYQIQKPDLIINLAMWSKEDRNASTKKVPESIEYDQVEILARSRAIESKVYFVFCNYGGDIYIKTRTGRIYEESSIGSTMIINPYGEIIAKTTGYRDEVLFVEIDLAKTHWAKY